MAIIKYLSFICKFYDNFLSLHKTPRQKGRIIESVYWILKTCPLFIRMLIVLRIMLICLLFIWINTLRTHLKLSFVFGRNADEYEGRCVLVYLQEGQNHKNQFFQGVVNKNCYVCKQIYRRQPPRRWAVSIMLLHSFIEKALLHVGRL